MITRIREAWARRDWYNLASIRNLWAITCGSFALSLVLIIPLALALPTEVLTIIWWAVWPTLAIIGTVFVLAYGVPRCEACGTKLRAGYYVCPACTTINAPREPRV